MIFVKVARESIVSLVLGKQPGKVSSNTTTPYSKPFFFLFCLLLDVTNRATGVQRPEDHRVKDEREVLSEMNHTEVHGVEGRNKRWKGKLAFGWSDPYIFSCMMGTTGTTRIFCCSCSTAVYMIGFFLD